LEACRYIANKIAAAKFLNEHEALRLIRESRILEIQEAIQWLMQNGN